MPALDRQSSVTLKNSDDNVPENVNNNRVQNKRAVDITEIPIMYFKQRKWCQFQIDLQQNGRKQGKL